MAQQEPKSFKQLVMQHSWTDGELANIIAKLTVAVEVVAAYGGRITQIYCQQELDHYKRYLEERRRNSGQSSPAHS